MAPQLPLNNRQQQVLKATIHRYIATAEPVGSEVLVREYNLSVSSATVRNAMGMLERSGFLYQPHTSSGRIPSDSGYRIYVDHLMPTTIEPAIALPDVLSQRLGGGWSLEAVLKGAAHILASLSGYITLVTLPTQRSLEVRHLQLVQIDPQQVMLIVVTDNYETQSFVVKLPVEPGEELDAALIDRELQVLSNFLNEALRGRSLQDLATLDWSELGREFDRYSNWFTAVLQDLSSRFVPGPTQLMISGVAEVMRQPEFMELSQLQNLLYLLEGEQNQLLPLLNDPLSSERDRRVQVRIGAENPLEPMRTCTLICTTYSRGNAQSVGTIGVVGPTRMDYENTIGLVEATADYLSNV